MRLADSITVAMSESISANSLGPSTVPSLTPLRNCASSEWPSLATTTWFHPSFAGYSQLYYHSYFRRKPWQIRGTSYLQLTGLTVASVPSQSTATTVWDSFSWTKIVLHVCEKFVFFCEPDALCLTISSQHLLRSLIYGHDILHSLLACYEDYYIQRNSERVSFIYIILYIPFFSTKEVTKLRFPFDYQIVHSVSCIMLWHRVLFIKRLFLLLDYISSYFLYQAMAGFFLIIIYSFIHLEFKFSE